MNKNVRIARQLVKIAKSLVADDRRYYQFYAKESSGSIDYKVYADYNGEEFENIRLEQQDTSDLIIDKFTFTVEDDDEIDFDPDGSLTGIELDEEELEDEISSCAEKLIEDYENENHCEEDEFERIVNALKNGTVMHCGLEDGSSDFCECQIGDYNDIRLRNLMVISFEDKDMAKWFDNSYNTTFTAYLD